MGGKLSSNLKERPEYGYKLDEDFKTKITESGGPAMVAAHSRRFESVFGNAEIPGALAILQLVAGTLRGGGLPLIASTQIAV